MEWKPSVDAGLMRVLIMGMPTRHPSYPDVPTLREAGFPFDIEVPFGLVGPSGMNPAVVARLHDAFKTANEAPSMALLYTKFDIIPRYATGDDFRKLFETIHADMKPVIEGHGRSAKNRPSSTKESAPWARASPSAASGTSVSMSPTWTARWPGIGTSSGSH